MDSLFPHSIDGYAQIRIVRDNKEEVLASDHNSLRSATIAIEQTLGINPQGTFGTLVERLDEGYQEIVHHAMGLPPRHYGSDIDQNAKAGVEFSFAYGTVDSQLTETIGYFNDLASTAGADLVGANGFTTTPYGSYTFEETTTQGQIQEAGSFLDKDSTLISRLFDSFVISGMEVTAVDSESLVVNITAGQISIDGRLMSYGGEYNLTLLTTPGTDTYYVYAIKTSEAISIRGVSCGDFGTVLSFSYFRLWILMNVFGVLHLIIHLIAVRWRSNVFTTFSSVAFIVGAALTGILNLILFPYYL